MPQGRGQAWNQGALPSSAAANMRLCRDRDGTTAGRFLSAAVQAHPFKTAGRPSHFITKRGPVSVASGGRQLTKRHDLKTVAGGRCRNFHQHLCEGQRTSPRVWTVATMQRPCVTSKAHRCATNSTQVMGSVWQGSGQWKTIGAWQTALPQPWAGMPAIRHYSGC